MRQNERGRGGMVENMSEREDGEQRNKDRRGERRQKEDGRERGRGDRETDRRMRAETKRVRERMGDR